jgi:hypothetical protein
MWNRSERYCTACALVVLAAFVALALYVDPSFAAVSGCKAAPSAADRYACQLANYTEWLVIATGALVVATVILGAIGIFQWRALHRSADISERALTGLETPAIYVNVMESGITPTDSTEQPPRPSTLRYCFVNHGRSPAHIIDYAEEVRSVPIGGGWPPPIDVAAALHRQHGWGNVVPPNGGESAKVSVNLLTMLMTPQREMFYSDDNAIFLTVVARYHDMFRNRYLTGFCFQFDRLTSAFVLTGTGANLNFLRRET